MVYICPMDAGVRQPAPGKCPVCSMTLVPSTPDEFLEYVLEVQSSPPAVLPGRPVTLKFVVSHPRTGERIGDFVLVHEKFFHLFIVHQDLNYFAHVHPEQQRDGSFALTTRLPRAGAYQLLADFLPEGGTPQMIQRSLLTAGFSGDLRPARLTADRAWIRRQNGLKIELLHPAGSEKTLTAGKSVLLTARLTEAQSGRPVTDLEQYLGAWGHMLILSEDLADAVHVHPAPETKTGGPEVVFEARFPRPGKYRVWTQFQRGGQVLTAWFTVTAEPLDAAFLKPR